MRKLIYALAGKVIKLTEKQLRGGHYKGYEKEVSEILELAKKVVADRSDA